MNQDDIQQIQRDIEFEQLSSTDSYQMDEWYEDCDDDEFLVTLHRAYTLRKAGNGHLFLEDLALYEMGNGQFRLVSYITTLGECLPETRKELINLGRQIPLGSFIELSQEFIERMWVKESLSPSLPSYDDIPF